MAYNNGRRTYKKKQNVKVATKSYVKKAIEAKRDVLTECYSNIASIGYDSPYIADLSAVPNGLNGQDYDFHGMTLHTQMGGTSCFARLVIIQWFEDESVDAPTLGKVFCDGTTSPQTVFYQGFNESNLHQKFMIVKEKLVQLTTNKNDVESYFKMMVKKSQLQRKVFRCTAGTGHKNNIYCIICPSNLVATPLTVRQGITFSYKKRD